jgi:hypothetical protein
MLWSFKREVATWIVADGGIELFFSFHGYTWSFQLWKDTLVYILHRGHRTIDSECQILVDILWVEPVVINNHQILLKLCDGFNSLVQISPGGRWPSLMRISQVHSLMRILFATCPSRLVVLEMIHWILIRGILGEGAVVNLLNVVFKIVTSDPEFQFWAQMQLTS